MSRATPADPQAATIAELAGNGTLRAAAALQRHGIEGAVLAPPRAGS